MPFINSSTDGACLHYLDYRPATWPPPALQCPALQTKPMTTLVFIHGWPMSSLMYEHLMLPLCETHRLRCVAIDRRGFGKSEWYGGQCSSNDVAGARLDADGDITYETFARDTVDVLEALGLERFVFVASSMGCGETVLAHEMLSDRMRSACHGFVWLGPSLPYPLATTANPMAPSRELWVAILTGLRANRAGFVKASLPGVFGVPAGIEVDEAVLARYEYIVHQADALATERCVQIITHKDFKEDLEKLGRTEHVKVLMIHGDSDQGAPFETSTKLVGDLMPAAAIKVYQKAAHGLYVTHAAQVIEDILGFVASLSDG